MSLTMRVFLSKGLHPELQDGRKFAARDWNHSAGAMWAFHLSRSRCNIGV